MLDVQLVVLAKQPLPGRVKTRLCPPLQPAQAAAVAGAALQDTLTAGLAGPFAARTVALDGDPAGLVPAGWAVVDQGPGGGLDRRLAHVTTALLGRRGAPPLLLIGMDTPQVTAAQLAEAALALRTSGSVLGLAADGGWWAIGLTAPDPQVFLDVPMSLPTTGAAQQARMRERGLHPAALPVLRDIDLAADLHEVAAAMPPTAALPGVLHRICEGAR